MPRPLRLVTAVAFAQLLASAIAVALRNTGARVDVSITDGQLTNMPGAVFWACVVLLVLAWTYLLAGALHAHPAVRVIALVLFSGAMYAGGANASLDTTQGVLAAVALAGIWAVGLATIAVDRRHPGMREPTWMRVAETTAVLVLVAALYALAWWGAGAKGTPRDFTLGVSIQLAILSLLLIPALLLAGSEFAEWGELAGERAAHLLERVRARALLPVAAMVVAVAVLAGLVDRYDVGPVAKQLVLGAILAGAVLLALRGRSAESRGARVPAWAPVAAAVAIAGIFLIGTAVSSSASGGEAGVRRLPVLGELAEYNHPAPPLFSLEYPAAWKVAPQGKQTADQGATAFAGTPAGDPALFVVAGTLTRAAGGPPPPRLGEVVHLLNPGWKVTLEHPKRSGPWTETRFKLVKTVEQDGVGWTRVVGRYNWLLFGYGVLQLKQVNERAFVEMRDTWRPTPAAAEGEAAAGGAAEAQHEKPRADVRTAESGSAEKSKGADSVDRVIAVCAAVWLLVALAAALALRKRRGRRGVAVFALVTGAAFVLTALPQVWLVVFGSVPDWMPGLRVAGFQAAAAVAAAGVAVFALARPGRVSAGRVGALLALCVGLQALAWFQDLYTGAIGAGGRFTLAAAAILLLSLAWDLATSGESVTNGHGRLFPRAARVLMYCGYIALVAVAVAYFSSLHVQATGNGIEALFEADRWPRLGIALLGAPLLVTGFALALGRREPG